MKITPKNWSEFQHYKDRSPAWIKLHSKLLDDFTFHSLPVASRALAPMLWLIASEFEEGVINAPPGMLEFRLRMTKDEVTAALMPLIQAGFFILEQDASDAIADHQQGAISRREEEEKKEAKASSSAAADPPAAKSSIPLCPHERIRALYHEVLPELPTAKLWGNDRQTALRARWAETAKLKAWVTVDDGCDWFRRFFEAVSADDWLMGRTKRSAGHEGWECTIDYLLSPRGFRKVVETAGRTKEPA